MCFNKELSIIVFIFGLITSIKLLLNNDILNAVFLFLIALMQLVEFFLWTFQNVKSMEHQFWSVMIFVVICLQFYIMYILNIVYNNFEYNSSIFIICTIMMILFTLTNIYFIFNTIIPRFGYFKTVRSNDTCRLNWSVYEEMYNKDKLLLSILTLSYLIGILIIAWINLGPIGFSLALFFLIIIFLYGYMKTGKITTSFSQVPTFWCLICCIFIVLIILYK